VRSSLTTGLDLFDYVEQQNGCDVAAPPPQIPCARPAEELPDDFLCVAQVLRHHVGQGDAIKALEIAQAAGIHLDGTPGSRARRVRHLLEVHFTDLSFPVCADSTGYYRPENADELSHYHANLYGRLRAIALRISTLKKLARIAGYEHAGHTRWQANPPTSA